MRPKSHSGAVAKASSDLPEFFSRQIAEARRFYMNLNPPRAHPLSAVCGGREHCQPDYEIHRSGFDYWGIEFVAQGEGTLRLAGKDHALTPGTLFSYGPGIPQDITTDSAQTMVKYFINFADEKGEALLRECGPVPGEVVHTSAPGEILSIFDDLIRCGLKQTRFQSRIEELLVEYLIVKIGESSIPHGAVHFPAFANYRRCHQVIEDGWFHLHSLNEIAAECHIDPAYLCRLFKRFDHLSPYQYLLRLKMNHAASLLNTPGATVQQVSDVLEFTDVFHFSRVFKKIMGVTPAKFARSSTRH